MDVEILMNILLVEDDVSLSNGVKIALYAPDYSIIQCLVLWRQRGLISLVLHL